MKLGDRAKIFACSFAGFMEGFGIPFALYLVSGFIDKLAIWLFWPMIGFSIFTGLFVAHYEGTGLFQKIQERDRLSNLIDEIKPQIARLQLEHANTKEFNDMLQAQIQELDIALEKTNLNIQTSAMPFMAPPILPSSLDIKKTLRSGPISSAFKTVGGLLRKVAVPVAAVVSAVFAVFVDAVELVDHMPRVLWHTMLGVLAGVSLFTAGLSTWVKSREEKKLHTLELEVDRLSKSNQSTQHTMWETQITQQRLQTEVNAKQTLLRLYPAPANTKKESSAETTHSSRSTPLKCANS